jgi:hypothetical protein
MTLIFFDDFSDLISYVSLLPPVTGKTAENINRNIIIDVIICFSISFSSPI